MTKATLRFQVDSRLATLLSQAYASSEKSLSFPHHATATWPPHGLPPCSLRTFADMAPLINDNAYTPSGIP